MVLSAFTLAIVSPVFVAEEVSNAASDAIVTLTANKGSLTIDYASHLLFDTHALSSKAKTYTTVTEKPLVQVTDARGTGAGWTLQVAATKFTDANTNKELKGVTLTLEVS